MDINQGEGMEFEEKPEPLNSNEKSNNLETDEDEGWDFECTNITIEEIYEIVEGEVEDLETIKSKCGNKKSIVVGAILASKTEEIKKQMIQEDMDPEEIAMAEAEAFSDATQYLIDKKIIKE